MVINLFKSVNKRKLLTGAVSLAAALSVSVTSLAASYPYKTQLVDNVNMRRNAYSTSTVLERLQKGDTVTILGEAGEYYRISFDGRVGYAMKEFVTGNEETPVEATVAPEKEETTVAQVDGYPYETTTNANVNLRKSANTSSKLVTRIAKGDSLQVNGVSGSFLAVTYRGMDGYVMADFVNVKQVTTQVEGATVSVPGNDTYIYLQIGASGTEVRALQQALIELGYLTGKVDGQYGANTEKAVRALQAMNEYPQTGIADINLQALIFEGKPLNSKGAKTSINTLPPIKGTTIKLNNTGDAVTALQERLQFLGYYDGKITGVYDKATQTAVKSFQKKNGVKVDGLAGAKTQEALFNDQAVDSTSKVTAAPVTATPKPTPTVTPSALVKKGTQGEDARLVQQRLKDLGYLAGKADGIFGAESVEALRTFQKQHDLSPDGMCGSDTRKLLFSSKAKAYAAPTPAPTEVPEATMEPVTKENVVTLRMGSSGVKVYYLQKRLTELGYYKARLDGNYLADDTAAVRAFQKANGLTVDGVAGYDTQVKLYSNSAVGPEGTNPTLETLRKGDRGAAVQEMQQRLINLGYLSGSADGIYGTGTAEAVIKFQKAHDLVRDGIAGKGTLTKLYSDDAKMASGDAQTGTEEITAGTTVRKGDINSAVKVLQQNLINLGYLSGKADGSFGVQTYAALLAFQANNGLAADGVAGANTWKKLMSSNVVGAGSTGTTSPSIKGVKAENVVYANWYSTIRAKARKYPYATVYDFTTGKSWQVHMFSFGAHADAEPLTAGDTATMLEAFGGKNTWNPKAVWVLFGDGSVYLASTHSMPHAPQHRTDNNFDGHLCIHFPRTDSQVAAIGPYATSHQKSIDKGWIMTQNLAK